MDRTNQIKHKNVMFAKMKMIFLSYKYMRVPTNSENINMFGTINKLIEKCSKQSSSRLCFQAVYCLVYFQFI